MAARLRYRDFMIGLASIVSVGCGGRMVEPPSSEASTVERENFVELMEEAICSSAMTCCESAGWQPRADCRHAVAEHWLPTVEYARAMGARFDSEQAFRCIELTRSEWQGCQPSKTHTSEIDIVCARVFSALPPRSLPGEACTASLDCEATELGVGTCLLLGSANGIRGTCLTTYLSGLGQPCGGAIGGTNAKCHAPYVCGEDQHCRAPFTLGQACLGFGGDSCVASTVCARGSPELCKHAKTVGEPCTTADDCENYACRSGRCRVAPDLPLSWYCSQAAP